MAYETSKDLTFYKSEGSMVQVGFRLPGDPTFSYLDVSLEAGVDVKDHGATAAAEAQGYFLSILGKDDKVIARFLGGQIGPTVGLHLNSLDKPGIMLGAEAKARATLSEALVGPIHLHFGAGITAAAKVEGGTLQLKLVGTGVTIGKRLGFSLFDNEFSVNIFDLLGL
ncbi:uncharacterized protein [Acropora muricata]|uniref:uncharacterized protein LOC114954711 n=1 Tax=Acropora millepora TaxID=45264 RepID=UPI0010FC8899|nr:uncharacterized protein LOC114954711 [Acropora millepora]XP_029187182.1 uncharacterized protein LOC114954711 [Acropora millepora]